MARRMRWYLPKMLLEVTIRTLDGRFWLRPDPACRAIVRGVFGKALKKYKGILLHIFDAQSNHLHYLISALVPAQVPDFLDYVHANIARQLNALRGRKGVFWSRSGAVIPVVDRQAQIDRFRYILAQGPAAGLVSSPTDWPGASAAAGLLGDMKVAASYTSLDERRRNARLKHPRTAAELADDVSFELAPLPVWEALTPAERRATHAEMVASIEAEHSGTQFLGANAVQAQSPDRVPRDFHPTPAPTCHASSADTRKRYRQAYDTFRNDYLAASDRLRRHKKATRLIIQKQYPAGALARGRWYVKPPRTFVPPWEQGPSDADAFQART